MTTFSKAGFRSLNYNSFRPHYPQSFYKLLADFVGRRAEKSIDLGCGTGVATFPLLGFSDHVTGLDLLPRMIDAANQLKEERLAELGIDDASRINFEVGAVEDFEGEPKTYDLITAAECIHWFKDYNVFFEKAARLLKPGGTLAYWYYVDPVFTDFSGSKGPKGEQLKKANDLYMYLVYEDPDGLGEFWEQPGRLYLKNHLHEVDRHIPSYFEKKIRKYIPSDGNAQHKEDDLKLVRNDINLEDFLAYITTYSSFHNYSEKKGTGEQFKEKFLRSFEAELGWDRKLTLVSVSWYSGYTFLKINE